MKIATLALLWFACLTEPAWAQRTAFNTQADPPATAPNGKATLSIINDKDDYALAQVTVRGHVYPLKEVNNLKTSASLLGLKWSPDSRFFSVNASDSGWVGGWHTFIYRLHYGAPTFISTEPILFPNLRHFAHCDDGPEINYQTVAWLKGGQQIIILASVADHSSCRNMDDYKAFILDTQTWRIVKIIPHDKVSKLWIAQTTGGV